jgi:hypothetical protein
VAVFLSSSASNPHHASISSSPSRSTFFGTIDVFQSSSIVNHHQTLISFSPPINIFFRTMDPREPRKIDIEMEVVDVQFLQYHQTDSLIALFCFSPWIPFLIRGSKTICTQKTAPHRFYQKSRKSEKPSRFLVQNLGKENQKLIGFLSGFIQNSIFK